MGPWTFSGIAGLIPSHRQIILTLPGQEPAGATADSYFMCVEMLFLQVFLSISFFVGADAEG